MSLISNENLNKALNWRYATKKFDSDKKISTEDWNTLEESLRMAPSSYGLQPWLFSVVTNPELKKELRAQSWKQSQVEDCSHLVAIHTLNKIDEAYVDEFVASIAKARGQELSELEGYKGFMMGDIVNGKRNAIVDHWAAKQGYIAQGFLLLAAATLEIDTCPLEGIIPAEYDKLLKVPEGYTTCVAVALGYRSSEDKYGSAPKVRFDRERVIRNF